MVVVVVEGGELGREGGVPWNIRGLTQTCLMFPRHAPLPAQFRVNPRLREREQWDLVHVDGRVGYHHVVVVVVTRVELGRARWGGVGLYKMFVFFKAFCARVNHPCIAPPTAYPTLLQYYCTTIAQRTPPPAAPTVVCHTPYNTGNANIV